MTKRTQQALQTTMRYNTLASAQSASDRRVYLVPVLLGDDGRYWLPATNREASILIKSGYEVAE